MGHFFKQNVHCRYCKEWGHTKWNCLKRPKGTPHPPPRTQVLTVEQMLDKNINSEDDAIVGKILIKGQ
jgi:hypothetical protein